MTDVMESLSETTKSQGIFWQERREGKSLQGTFLLQLLIDTGLRSKAVFLNKMYLGYSLTVCVTFQSLHMSILTRFWFYEFKIPSEISQVALTITEIKVCWPVFSSEVRLLSPMCLDSDLLFQSWCYRYILNSIVIVFKYNTHICVQFVKTDQML